MRPRGAGAPYPSQKSETPKPVKPCARKGPQVMGFRQSLGSPLSVIRPETKPTKSETIMDADDLLAAPSPWLRPALPPKFWASVDGFRVGFVCADKVGKPERPLKMGVSSNPVSLVSEFRSF